jgi:hypothetical protein
VRAQFGQALSLRRETATLKYVVNWYNADFHAVLENGPPLEGARLERHLFGLPPYEARDVWAIELDAIETLLPEVRDRGLGVTISSSGTWSGKDQDAPGELLFGLGVFDDVTRVIDPRDQPIMLVKASDAESQ